MTNEDIIKLIDFAKNNGISIQINFWESSGEYEIQTFSPASSECFYKKRCSSADLFIQAWKDNLTKLK